MKPADPTPPELTRQTVSLPPTPPSKLPMLVGALIAVSIVGGGLFLYWFTRSREAQETVVDPAEKALNDTRSPLAEEVPGGSPNSDLTKISPTIPTVPDPTKAQDSVNTGTDSPFALPSEDAYPQEELPSAQQADIAAAPSNLPNTAFNHLPYAQADSSRLTALDPFVREGYEREEALDAEAAQQFSLMKADAAAEGVQLMAISGFRTIVDQKDLFSNQIQRKGSESAAAQYSAPPGYSEHHTGYAVDIADVTRPDADIKLSFENTDAYQWLIVHAHEYGFEESFPKSNQQGVSFEPWHWRYVGTARAQTIFDTARRNFPAPAR